MSPPLAEAVDRFLEATIVLSFSRAGNVVRRWLWQWEDCGVHASGRTCLVTGANSGLGLATSEQLARARASVVMVVRDQEKGEAAAAQIRQRVDGADVRIRLLDVSDLSAVRQFAAALLNENRSLDVLVHNAGVLLSGRRLSTDGIELSLATNVLGPFLLTHKLAPLLERSAPARVIFVSSGGMYAQRLELSDPQFERRPFNGTLAYAQHKRALVVLAEMWAARLRGRGVAVNAMHPGWVDTPGLRNSLPRFWRLMRPLLRRPAQGADTIAWLAVSPEATEESGGFWLDRRRRSSHRLRRTVEAPEDRERLWNACMSLCGLQGSAPL